MLEASTAHDGRRSDAASRPLIRGGAFRRFAATGLTAGAGGKHLRAMEAPRLLYFSSPRSGPARRVEAFVDQILQQRRNHETFARRTIDVDAQPDLARKFGVEVVPTILVLDNGEIACRVEGRVGVPELRDALSPWLR